MPGTDLNITLPDPGVTSWPQWADDITTALDTIINDLEPQVVTSEFLENADHVMNGYALTDARYLTFRQGNTGNLPTLGAGFKNGDFWVCDSAGNQIQVTSGGTLTGVGNGFRGDTAYAKYTASSDLYEFLDSANNYDNVKATWFKVANGASAEATIKYAGAGATTFSLPTTAPAAVAVLTIDGSGNVAHNGTIAVGFTVNNANITLTGTADLKHPDITYTCCAVDQFIYSTDASWSFALNYTPNTSGGVAIATGGAQETTFAIPALRANQRLKSVVVLANKSNTASDDFKLYKVTANTTRTQIATTVTSAVSGDVTITMTVTSPAANTAGDRYVFGVSNASGGQTVTYYQVRYTIDNA